MFQKVTLNNIENLTKGYPATQLFIRASLLNGYQVDIEIDSGVWRLYVNEDHHIAIPDVRLPLNHYAAVHIADNKHKTLQVLKGADLPVAKSLLLERDRYREGLYDESSFVLPAVVKPARETLGGEGVIVDIRTKNQLLDAIESSFQKYKILIVEEYYAGLEDYRFLCLNGKVESVLHRVKPNVLGDGTHTVSELIRDKNNTRKVGKPIVINDELKKYIDGQGYDLDSILENGKTLTVRNICNFSSGGDVIDITEEVHSDTIAVAERAANVLGLNLVGLDFLLADPKQSIHEQRAIIVEANQEPHVRMHLVAKPDDTYAVHRKIMKSVFDMHTK